MKMSQRDYIEDQPEGLQKLLMHTDNNSQFSAVFELMKTLDRTYSKMLYRRARCNWRIGRQHLSIYSKDTGRNVGKSIRNFN